jgi:5'-3' exonuclease
MSGKASPSKIKAGEMARLGPADVRERYGVEPNQVPDFIALRGDASDHIPGAKGVGPKGAAALLRKYGSLDDAIADGRLAGQVKQVRPYRSIATMDRSAPHSPARRPGADLGQGLRAGPRMGIE